MWVTAACGGRTLLLLPVVVLALLGTTPFVHSEVSLLNYSLTPSTAAWEKTVIIVTGGRMGSTIVSGLVNCGIEPGCSGTPVRDPLLSFHRVV